MQDGNIFSKELIDIIKSGKDELGPWSLDFVRKHPLSSSWKFDGLELSNQNDVNESKVTFSCIITIL